MVIPPLRSGDAAIRPVRIAVRASAAKPLAPTAALPYISRNFFPRRTLSAPLLPEALE
jgi:hypothetical protein